MECVRYLIQGLAHCRPSVNAASWRGDVLSRVETNKQTDVPNPLKIIASNYLREKAASPKAGFLAANTTLG